MGGREVSHGPLFGTAPDWLKKAVFGQNYARKWWRSGRENDDDDDKDKDIPSKRQRVGATICLTLSQPLSGGRLLA